MTVINGQKAACDVTDFAERKKRDLVGVVVWPKTKKNYLINEISPRIRNQIEK